MINLDKIIKNAFLGKCTIDELFDSATFLIHDGDSKSIHKLLEIGHIPEVNKIIYKNDKVNDWYYLLSTLIKKSNYQLSNIFDQRANRYADKTFFQIISNETIISISFNETWNKVRAIGSYFKKNLSHSDSIGILTPNHINGALLDLACLVYGIRVVPIPLNLSSEHLNYVLTHAEITNLFIGSDQGRELFIESKYKSQNLSIINIDNKDWDIFWNKCLKNNIVIPTLKDLDSLASIMYTSGTTDNPKGIQFSQLNIVSKRFARALALPDIGPKDGFLCYLPLYHTFGRWFEMVGALFWGATYTFTENTSFKTLLRDFKLAKPSIFISIPKRWIQIQEHIVSSISLERSTDEEIRSTTNLITGGKLKWGLSAAGFLDPDIFKFFNENKISLLSGYGMTEATGGITMTPPEDYIANSVGKSLPGINLKLAKDNELLMQGDYVTRGYYKDEIEGSFIDSWFHTGDIFNYKKGHYFIIDRKKEIYKNSRGQTISPQKIENLFQDFEAIKSVFLVGDGKEFNTLLLYPDPKNKNIDLEKMLLNEKRTYYNSLVFSVNSFLPPYERIVNYALISRDFEHDRDELTTKNTYKRKAIIKNFNNIIEPMYEKNYISLINGNYEIRIPNWILRDKSLTRGDLSWDGKFIFQYKIKNKLEFKWSKTKLKIGNYYYNTTSTTISIEKFIRDPNLWIGNQPLVDFIGDIIFRVASFESYRHFNVDYNSLPFNKHKENIILNYNDDSIPSIIDLHKAAYNIFSKVNIKTSFEFLKIGISSPNYQLIIQELLLKLQFHPNQINWIKGLEILTPNIDGDMFINLFKSSKDFKVFKNFNLNTLELKHLKSIIILLNSYRNKIKMTSTDISIGECLIEMITNLVQSRPEFYMIVRGQLTLWVLVSKNKNLSQLARDKRSSLNKEFRKTIIDNINESAFQWNSIIQFDKNIPSDLKKKVEIAIKNSTLIRESIFIFSNGSKILLDDISDEGIWCTLIGQGHGKMIVRILVQLKDNRAFNFVINVNDNLDKSQFKRETNWLISIGASTTNQKLVEDFGSIWEKNEIFSEEYIPGETVLMYLERNQTEIASEIYPDRWQMRWLHFIWNGIAAYLEFWKNSGQTQMILDASTRNVIIPEYDYYTGTRLISISERRKADTIYDVIITLYKKFILETEKQFPGLKKMAEWEIIFTIVLEVFGTKEGTILLKNIKKGDKATGLNKNRISLFLKDIDEFGLLRKSVVFASLRYQRWLDLNPNATHKAKGVIIQDLYKDYKLELLSQKYPETRMRFFLMTAFKDTNPELIKKLNVLMNEMRFESVSDESLDSKLHQIHDEIDLTDSEKYFLTRLVFEHVDAADYAELISRDIGEKTKLDLVVLVEDKFSGIYKIRPPYHPKEVAKFHSELIEAKLEVQFESNHEFLLIFNKKNHLVGGVFWKSTGSGIAHLEKIVLTEKYRSKNLSTKLIQELFIRLRIKKIKYLTVGFFQSGLFYKLGFQINQKFGGLVKKL